MKEVMKRNIIGQSESIQQVIKAIARQAQFPTPVIITGETGTGKELAARGLHYSGPRASGPFIAVNCSTFTDDLFVSELFGYKKGAFTDAKTDHAGLLAAAERGSLFLDEIDSLSLKSQAALLRFLQENEYRPVGCSTTRTANVRLITATNQDLSKLINQGSFREDLYYRLMILTIDMPPLRDRLEDLAGLVEFFIEKLNNQYHLDKIGVSQPLLNALHMHNWPGNVRELENTVHRLYLTSDGELINDVVAFNGTVLKGSSASHLSATSPAQTCSEQAIRTGKVSFAEAKREAVEAFEQSFVTQVLSYTKGNVTQAASLCGKERRAFGKLVKKYGIAKSTPGHF